MMLIQQLFSVRECSTSNITSTRPTIARSANGLGPLALPTLPLAQRLVREHPSPDPLRLSLLAELRLGNPGILLQEVLACQCSRATDVHAPGAHAFEWVLLSKHVQVPESKRGGELDVTRLWVRALGGEADRCGGLQVAEDWDTGLCVDGRGVDGRSV